MSHAPSLTLYHYLGCPFCSMVERVLSQVDVGVEVQRRDILRDPQARQDLIDATGSKTVPVMKIGDGPDARWMPESRDIMTWLKQTYG